MVLQKRFHTHQKAPKSQKHKNAIEQKHKTQMSEQKLKVRLKNIQGEKSYLFAYLRFCACEEKK